MTLIENSKPKVFFDTNVIIDDFNLRDINYKASYHLFMLAVDNKINGYVCTKQITDIYYILRKYVSDDAIRKNMVNDICESLKMLPLLPSDLLLSFKSNLKDYEDAVLDEVAKVNCINFFVTHNKKDFENGSVVAVSPEDLYQFIINNNLSNN